jgi:hypothetical protein
MRPLVDVKDQAWNYKRGIAILIICLPVIENTMVTPLQVSANIQSKKLILHYLQRTTDPNVDGLFAFATRLVFAPYQELGGQRLFLKLA